MSPLPFVICPDCAADVEEQWPDRLSLRTVLIDVRDCEGQTKYWELFLHFLEIRNAT